MYILDMVAAGELSLDDVHTYRKGYHYMGGTGKVRYMEDGTRLRLGRSSNISSTTATTSPSKCSTTAMTAC